MTTQPIPRATARVLVLDGDDNLFLIHTAGEVLGIGLESVWLPPGGGVEPGESHEEAALRELREEVALREVALGPCVWVRTFPFERRGVRYEKRERFYICRVARFEIDATPDLDREGVLGYRWWSVDEIEASPEVFVPRALGRLLRTLLSDEPSGHPIAVEV
jgi:ADP-ribose pyrophosphatase YjhB (NUDIX family)